MSQKIIFDLNDMTWYCSVGAFTLLAYCTVKLEQMYHFKYFTLGMSKSKNNRGHINKLWLYKKPNAKCKVWKIVCEYF